MKPEDVDAAATRRPRLPSGRTLTGYVWRAFARRTR